MPRMRYDATGRAVGNLFTDLISCNATRSDSTLSCLHKLQDVLTSPSNEPGRAESPPAFSPGSTAEPEPQVSAPSTLPPPLVTTLPQAEPYYTQPASPMPVSAAEARYTSNPFRTPRLPSSVIRHSFHSSPTSDSSPTFQ